MGAVAEAVSDVVQGASDFITDTIVNVSDTVLKPLGGFGEQLAKAGEEIGRASNAVAQGIQDVVMAAGDAVTAIGQGVESTWHSIADAAQQTVYNVQDAGRALDKGVNDVIPGGWVTVAAIAATIATMGAAGETIPAAMSTELAIEAAVEAGTLTAAEAAAMTAAVEAGAMTAAEAGALATASIQAGSLAAVDAAAISASATTGIAGSAAGGAVAAAGTNATVAAGLPSFASSIATSMGTTLPSWVATSLAGVQTGALIGAGTSAVNAAINGGDPLQAALKGAMYGGLTGGVAGAVSPALTSALSGVGGLPASVTNALASSLAGAAGSTTTGLLTGQDPSRVLQNAALGLGLGAIANVGGNALGLNPYVTAAGTGALGSLLKGGDPLQGAISGAIGAGVGAGVRAGLDFLKAPTDQQIAADGTLGSKANAVDAMVKQAAEEIQQLRASGASEEEVQALHDQRLAELQNMAQEEIASLPPSEAAKVVDIGGGVEQPVSEEQAKKYLTAEAEKISSGISDELDQYKQTSADMSKIKADLADKYTTLQDQREVWNDTAKDFKAVYAELKPMLEENEAVKQDYTTKVEAYQTAYNKYNQLYDSTVSAQNAAKDLYNRIVSTNDGSLVPQYNDLYNKFNDLNSQLTAFADSTLTPAQDTYKTAAAAYNDSINKVNEFYQNKYEPAQLAFYNADTTIKNTTEDYTALGVNLQNKSQELEQLAMEVAPSLKQINEIASGKLGTGYNAPTIEQKAEVVQDPWTSSSSYQKLVNAGIAPQVAENVSSDLASTLQYNKDTGNYEFTGDTLAKLIQDTAATVPTTGEQYASNQGVTDAPVYVDESGVTNVNVSAPTVEADTSESNSIIDSIKSSINKFQGYLTAGEYNGKPLTEEEIAIAQSKINNWTDELASLGDPAAQASQAANESQDQSFWSKLGGLFSFGTPSQNATETSLFGPGVTASGEDFTLFAFDSLDKKQQTIFEIQATLDDPNTSAADKEIAKEALVKAQQTPVKNPTKVGGGSQEVDATKPTSGAGGQQGATATAASTAFSGSDLQALVNANVLSQLDYNKLMAQKAASETTTPGSTNVTGGTTTGGTPAGTEGQGTTGTGTTGTDTTGTGTNQTGTTGTGSGATGTGTGTTTTGTGEGAGQTGTGAGTTGTGGGAGTGTGGGTGSGTGTGTGAGTGTGTGTGSGTGSGSGTGIGTGNIALTTTGGSGGVNVAGGAPALIANIVRGDADFDIGGHFGPMKYYATGGSASTSPSIDRPQGASTRPALTAKTTQGSSGGLDFGVNFTDPQLIAAATQAPQFIPLKFADGGHVPQFFSEGGLNSLENRYVQGDGDGTSDDVPAMLANGEFVIPADVVSSLGNGSNESGANILDEFLQVIRAHRQNHDPKELPPDSLGPLAYLNKATKKAGK